MGLVLWKGAEKVNWRKVRARILRLSDEQQIREILATLPESNNARWMKMSLDAGRNVISPDELLQFLDPSVPIDVIFEKGKHLGKGAFGSVDLQFNSQGREFAIKAMTPNSWHPTPVGEQDFTIGLALDHENIVRVHNLVERKDFNYLIMEYIPGQTIWDAGKKVSRAQRQKMAKQLADALAHALERGIIPEDLHGGNMIMTTGGNLKLVDLGLYQRMDDNFLCLEEAQRNFFRAAQPFASWLTSAPLRQGCRHLTPKQLPQLHAFLDQVRRHRDVAVAA